MNRVLHGPAPRDFVGYGPLTEPESLAVYNFTLQHNFRLILIYHSQGEVIYWQFQNYAPPDAFSIGTQFSNCLEIYMFFLELFDLPLSHQIPCL